MLSLRGNLVKFQDFAVSRTIYIYREFTMQLTEIADDLQNDHIMIGSTFWSISRKCVCSMSRVWSTREKMEIEWQVILVMC